MRRVLITQMGLVTKVEQVPPASEAYMFAKKLLSAKGLVRGTQHLKTVD